MNLSPTVLVTGINGFVGQHMVRHLLSLDVHVVGIGRRERCPIQHECLQYETCDLMNLTQLKQLFLSNRFDYVIHLAAQKHVTGSWDDPIPPLQTNLLATMNLIDCVRQQSEHVSRMLIVGTAHEYQLGTRPVLDESSPEIPGSPYGWSKLLQTQLGKMYSHLYQIPVVMARTFNLIGPGTGGGVCSKMAKEIVEIERGTKKPMIRLGDLQIKRDFLDVRDAVRAYWKLMNSKDIHMFDIFNVCRGETYQLATIVDQFKQLAMKDFKAIEDTMFFRPNDPAVICGDHSKLTKYTQWKPKIPLERSLRDMLNDWRRSI